MDSEKKRIFRIVSGLVALVAVVAGFALIALMPVLKITDGEPLALQYFIGKVIPLFTNPSDIDALKAGFFPMFVVFTYAVTYIFGLIYIIKLIVDLFSKKEDADRKIRFDTASLSFVLLGFFAFLSFIMLQKNDPTDEIRLGLGSFFALGLGGVGALASACGYFMTSDKPVVNKVLRICLMAVSFAAAVLVFMQIFVVEGQLMSPFHLVLIIGASSFYGGTPNMTLAMIATGLSAALIIAFAFMNSIGVSALETKKNKDPKFEKVSNIAMIVLAAVAVVLTAAVIFVGPIVVKDPEVLSADPLHAYLALGAVVLALVLAILVVAVPEKAVQEGVTYEPSEEPAEEAEEPVEEPVQKEKPVEEKAEVAEAVIVADEVTEEPKAEEAKEEPKEEEKPQEVAPKEEKPAPAKKTAKKEKAPAKEEKKEAPKKEAAPKKAEAKKEFTKKEEAPKKVEEKKAPAKKAAPKKAEEKKEEAAKEPEEKKDAPKKNTASYHVSKRASDNKWQVFRAGSDKVIKLFDTKVEAEEYTKRMAENQGVSYLSHASKGKNKGRIQKK